MPLVRTARTTLLCALVVLAGGCDSQDGPRDPGATTFGGRPHSEFIFDRDVFLSATDPPAAEAADVGQFAGAQQVMGVVVGEEARAYPIGLLAYHHVVNDVLGGQPIAVTFCVLCSSGIVFDPVVDGRRLTFGVDGAWRGTATLYDQQTDSTWLHLSGECLAGPLAGTMLRPLPRYRHTTWDEWRTAHPDTTVMLPVTTDAGGPTAGGYLTIEGSQSGSPFVPERVRPTMPPAEAQPRLDEYAVVEGVVVGTVARAYPFDALAKVRVVEEEIAGTPVTVWFHPPSRAVVVFDRRSQDRVLSFEVDAQGVVRDAQTHSRWTLDGGCVEGDLAGRSLRPLHALRAEWYGWRSHYPATTVWDLDPQYAD